MRPGIVAAIRVNPKDCMSVIDVMDTVGINTEGMSFPAMVSLTLSSLLEGARASKQIPTRDGFEYSDMMEPFIGTVRTRRKLEITNALHQVGSEVKVQEMKLPQRGAFEVPLRRRKDRTTAQVSAQHVLDESPSAEQLRSRRRLTELLQKKDMTEAGIGGVLWQASDQQEYEQLYKEIYPEG